MTYIQEPGRPPGEPEPGDSGDVVVVSAPARRERPSLPTPLAIFVGALVLAMVTFGSSVALLTRVATLGSPGEGAPTPVPTRAATPAPVAVGITAGAATAERRDTGGYTVTFTWTLDGARSGDIVRLRFSMGSRVVSEQSGALDSTLFSSSTGQFTLATQQECSADGWSAEVILIRSVAPVGDATSRAAGVSCP